MTQKKLNYTIDKDHIWMGSTGLVDTWENIADRQSSLQQGQRQRLRRRSRTSPSSTQPCCRRAASRSAGLRRTADSGEVLWPGHGLSFRRLLVDPRWAQYFPIVPQLVETLRRASPRRANFLPGTWRSSWVTSVDSRLRESEQNDALLLPDHSWLSVCETKRYNRVYNLNNNLCGPTISLDLRAYMQDLK